MSGWVGLVSVEGDGWVVEGVELVLVGDEMTINGYE